MCKRLGPVRVRRSKYPLLLHTCTQMHTKLLYLLPQFLCDICSDKEVLLKNSAISVTAAERTN